jgi:glutaredoxin-like YruB-family protein
VAPHEEFCWANRELIGNILAKRNASTEVTETPATEDFVPAPVAPAPSVSTPPGPTPHPAREAQVQARTLYPGLAVANSSLNQKFVALYKDAQANNPALLSSPDWPLTLADKAIVALGGSPMPRTAAAGAQPSQAKQVVIYTTSHCPYCVKAKQYFTQKNIRYREIDIEKSTSGDAEFKKLGGTGVPLIMVGNTKLQGFSASKLDQLFGS